MCRVSFRNRGAVIARVLEDTHGFPGGIETIDWPKYSVAKVARKRRNFPGGKQGSFERDTNVLDRPDAEGRQAKRAPDPDPVLSFRRQRWRLTSKSSVRHRKVAVLALGRSEIPLSISLIGDRDRDGERDAGTHVSFRIRSDHAVTLSSCFGYPIVRVNVNDCDRERSCR